jgi:predicted nucleic-acid-binding protein
VTGIDTNVLARYIVQDDPKQSKVASLWIEEHCTPDSPGFVNSVVLCELTWVLERGYGYGRETVVAVLSGILSSPELRVEDDEAAWQALKLYDKDAADFSDCLIGLTNRRTGSASTVTFDRKAAKQDFFELLK